MDYSRWGVYKRNFDENSNHSKLPLKREKQEVFKKLENTKHLKSSGIETALGEATFNSKNSILVNGKEYFSEKIIIATGSAPRRVKIEGQKKTKIFTNEEIFNINLLPKRLLVVGGGPIGCELAQAFSNLGSNVVIVQRGNRLLTKEP